MDGATGRRSVFISYTGDQPITEVSKAIEDRGYEPFSSYDIPAARPHLETLQKKLAEARFGVFLIDDPEQALNASVELGVALAVGLPALIVTPPGVRLPEIAAALPVVRAEVPDDRRTLDEALAAIDDLAAGDAARNVPIEAPPLGERSADLLSRLDRLSTPGYGTVASGSARTTGMEAQDILATAFTEADLRVVREPLGRFSQADFAVWDASLEPFVAAPLLVEMATGRWSGRRLELKIRQLDEYVRQLPPGRWAMLVLAPERPDRGSLPDLIGDRRVLVIGLRELLERMRDERFADIVRMLRNERVHS